MNPVSPMAFLGPPGWLLVPLWLIVEAVTALFLVAAALIALAPPIAPVVTDQVGDLAVMDFPSVWPAPGSLVPAAPAAPTSADWWDVAALAAGFAAATLA